MNEETKARRGHPIVPEEDYRVTLSCRVHPSTRAYIKSRRLKAGRILDRAIERIKKEGDL